MTDRPVVHQRFVTSCRSLVVWLFLSAIAATIGAEATEVKIVYPKLDQVVTAVDSTFIFGVVTGDFDPKNDWLDINGQVVEVHKDGGFLAFLPITPGEFRFTVRAFRFQNLPLYGEALNRYQLLAENFVEVTVPTPRSTLPEDTLQIIGDYRPPAGDLVLASGDLLPVKFQGTPRGRAWFSITGVVDSIPMSEMEPRQQPYWGEAVFGIGAIPDSVLIGGIYTGFYQVPESVSVVDARITYHLVRLDNKFLRPVSTTIEDTTLERKALPEIIRESRYRISLNHPAYPFTVRFIDSVQTIRHGPRLGYFSIYQPRGVEALVVGREGDWYRLKLSSIQYAWAYRGSVVTLGEGLLPPVSRPSAVRSYSFDDYLLLQIGLAGRHAFRVYEDDPRTLRLQLFGVTTNTDWIRYDFSDSLLDLATWAQPEDGVFELRLRLNQDLWGYDTYYEGNTFCLRLNRPPERTKYLWGKTIVIDPGHSSDAGAVGPTGLTEAEANLGISLALRRELEKQHATVIMTRDDMSHVSLYDRPAIAKLVDADLFVSVHNNALPDGVNPFENHGVSTYYYHPHSADLAKAIQKELLRATGLPDYGLYHGNLAVNRATQYPAVLVECAFMMIPEQEALLKTERFQNKVAQAISKGIESFLKQYDERNH